MGSGLYFHKVGQMSATRVWINNPTRLQAKKAIEAGACGCTANPAYLSKILYDQVEGEYVRDIIRELVPTENDDLKLLEELQRRVVKGLADLFYPVYKDSKGKNGFVSIQGDPFNETEENIVEYALKNHAMAPNITPKIPFVKESFGAVEKLLQNDVPLNITEVMSVHQYYDLMTVYNSVREEKGAMPEVFCSHILGIFNEYLKEYVKENEIDIDENILAQAGSIIAKKLVEIGQQYSSPIRWISGGARTLTDFTGLVGSNMNITINWPGAFEVLLEEEPLIVEAFKQPVPVLVLDELLEKVVEFKRGYMVNGLTAEEYDDYGPVVKFRKSFQKGWNIALEEISKIRSEMN